MFYWEESIWFEREESIYLIEKNKPDLKNRKKLLMCKIREMSTKSQRFQFYI